MVFALQIVYFDLLFINLFLIGILFWSRFSTFLLVKKLVIFWLHRIKTLFLLLTNNFRIAQETFVNRTQIKVGVLITFLWFIIRNYQVLFNYFRSHFWTFWILRSIYNWWNIIKIKIRHIKRLILFMFIWGFIKSKLFHIVIVI